MKDLLTAQRERAPVAARNAEEKLQRVVGDPAAERLLNTARTAGTAAQRVTWLQRTASAWSKPLEAVAACRKGCSHCCKIPVTMTDIEAKQLGARLGVKPDTPKFSVSLAAIGFEEEDLMAAQLQLREAVPATACPFLVDEECAIYAARPLACRLHLNLDEDDLLCRPSGSTESFVPLANAMTLKGMYLALQPSAILADIRDFFPRGAAR